MKQNPKARMEEMKISFYSHMDEKNESDSGKTVLIFDQISVMKVDRKYELCREKVTEVIHCVIDRN
ncbi:unnamed protein product [Arabidopsis thaliana]|uniref:Uncharacterized protein n=1 Tax=Arabidopsis thaliana TaxID=3702 RepID=A0A654FP78_ARATH|nr:unnamed protein product [Arabidopsis thaliana]